MKGKHTIIVRNRRIQFTLELERNITVIRGNSATGKTTLIGMLQDYEAQGSQSGVVVETDRPCRVLTTSDWEDRLHSMENCVVFIDEGNQFVTSEAFAKAIMGTSNYYVLITRENLHQLPYSVEAILELRQTSRHGKIVCNQTYPYYKSLPQIADLSKSLDFVLTEDSNAGYQMFSYLSEKMGQPCISAKGKSNIYTKLNELRGKRTLVIADGAAFGADMDTVYQLQTLYPHAITLYLPESFEWLLLKSGIIRGPQLEEILSNPSAHIESSEFFSWEQFFTALLMALTSVQEYMRYNKQRLAPFYFQDENIHKILRTIENG